MSAARFRGYPIEQLAEKSSHLESAYLLIYGSLPTKDQFKHFESEVSQHGVMHADAEQFFRSFRYDAHPMSMLTSAFAMLGSFYSDANPSLRGMRPYLWDQPATADSLMIVRSEVIYTRQQGIFGDHG